jgi:hypothetical protein
MTAPGPGVRKVRDALARRQDELIEGLIAQAQVTAVGTNTVTVRFPGGAASSDQAWPRLRSYTAPVVGDLALMVGRPGSWVALGPLA